jgi:UPF0755 protein
MIYIPAGSDFNQVIAILVSKKIISDEKAFRWVAEKKKYTDKIKPGRYRIANGLNNNDLVNLLRSGRQEPLMLSFNNIRTLEELAEVVSEQLEPGKTEFMKVFNNDSVASYYGFTEDSFPLMFIPNSYEFYWDTKPDEFVSRMKREYVAFWSKGRLDKAKKIGLNQVEVGVLASIVDQETLYDDENSKIAGVFMNRLEKGIPLQSDPTVIFALGDFSVRRVLNKDRQINSPYNTYKNRGLPPGPISIPSVASIDAVLDYEKHNYYYFCAKPDFSGYHNFASTLSQHNKNARLYQQALNQRKIFR